MDFYYELIETVADGEAGERRGYGVACRFGKGERLVAEDIFDDESRVRSLVSLFNRERVEPEHFMDIINDLLC